MWTYLVRPNTLKPLMMLKESWTQKHLLISLGTLEASQEESSDEAETSLEGYTLGCCLGAHTLPREISAT